MRKKRKKYWFMVLPLLLGMACNSSPEGQNKADFLPESIDARYKIDMHFAEQPWSENADSLYLRFRIVDTQSKNNLKKVFWEDLKKEDFKILESDGNPSQVFMINSLVDNEMSESTMSGKSGKQAGDISQNAVFRLMVDRSNTISAKDMERMMAAIRETVENLPDSSVYISFFAKQVSKNRLITKENFSEFEKEFEVKPEIKDLYQCIISNFEDFVQDPLMPEADKYLLVFTDGKIDENRMEDANGATRGPKRIKEIDNMTDNRVQIHAFRYGDNLLANQPLKSICMTHRKENLVGGFYEAKNVADIVESLGALVEDLSADYELVLLNPSNKIYYGDKLTLQVQLKNQQNEMAVGEMGYSLGSMLYPQGPGVKAESAYVSILLGLIILGVAFFIMQAGIPYIISRVSSFEKKYVKPYEPIILNGNEVHDQCFSCGDPIERGEMVVVKCVHKMHTHCWEANGHKCVEYGQNCKEGIQYYFDSKHPFDLKKSPYYLKWAMSGLTGGFCIWMIYHLCLFVFKLKPFAGFIDSLLKACYPERLKVDGQILSEVYANFQHKLSGFLLAGILLGFVLTFLFSYINEFRQKKGRVLFSIFLRACIGAAAGFAAFLIGSLICILLGVHKNVAWIDVISWFLFGGGVAFCLSCYTTIRNRDALIGGLIAGALSFFILYAAYIFPTFGAMFSFMLCSAGLGIAIVAKHQMSQKYFLHYKGETKGGEIAIHKWMNESGGSNEVSIGKSSHCVIQMNWDNSELIHDKQVQLYIDPKRKIPVLKVLENGMSYDKRDAQKDELHQLRNGVKFKIGNTEFEYIEK